MVKANLKTSLGLTSDPVPLMVTGVASNGGQRLEHEAVPAEDRMQAFLWRHLVPAQELLAYVFVPPPLLPKAEPTKAATNAPVAEFPQGQLLHFGFDQWEQNNLVSDKTGRGNSGRLYGARWMQAGKHGGGCEFVITNSYIQVTNAPVVEVKQVTLAGWFRTSGASPSGRYLFDKPSGAGYALSIVGDDKGAATRGRLCFEVGVYRSLGDGVVADGLWHHVAATFDGKALKLYVDGVAQKQVQHWQGALTPGTNGLFIGVCKARLPEKSQCFNGAMDELMVFDHALRNTEIKVVMASTRPRFTKDQVVRRLQELKELRDRGLILQDFYAQRVKECEVIP